MDSPEDFTSQAILQADKTAPGALVCAHALLAALEVDHPLYLPISADTELWADFSELPIMLSALTAGLEKPTLPIDISPLAALCKEHEDEIGERETWTYPFFYLELLAKERRLCPLFWGTSKVASRLRTHEAYEVRNSGREQHHRRCKQIWETKADKWIRKGRIEPHDDRPWLNRLWYREPEDDWDSPREFRFSIGLEFAKIPFYDMARARQRLIRAMKIDLWRTSIFCPAPMSRHETREWEQACQRFALHQRRTTMAEVRKSEFEKFVRARHEKGMPIKTMAREAVEKSAYPFGTRKRGFDEQDDIESCRRAIYRLLEERERFWRREDGKA